MTGILTFETRYGPVAVEVEDQVAAGGAAPPPGLVPKGGRGSQAGEVMARAPGTLEEALSTLHAYTATLQDVLGRLALAPSKVSVELGLKMTGSAGFILAKAETNADLRIALEWEPAKAAGKIVEPYVGPDPSSGPSQR